MINDTTLFFAFCFALDEKKNRTNKKTLIGQKIISKI